jgi:nucleotide-binding universal stress UspA family protein
MKLWKTILVPHDLSRHARRALKIAAGLAGRRGKLVVLSVVNEYANAPFQKKVLERGRRALERAVPAKLPNRPSIELRVEAGDPARRIIQAARGADSIVMCTRGRSGLSRLVIGSVAEKVVRHAPVPVLSFRPKGARARAS